jgi:hypothetical protein
MTNPLRRMETTVKKANTPLIIVGSAALAAAMTTLVSTAEAGKHHGGGFRHHHHHRHVYIAPVYTETYKVVRKPAAQPQQKVAVIRYTDGMGRVYDVASKAWHDGQNHCWSGKLGWTFKNGAWSYGSFRWYEADGTWRTNAPEAPKSVACETIAAFAGKVAPTAGQAGGQKELAGTEKAQSGGPAQLALPADGNAAATSECKKYFPSVGEMLPVPCTNDRSSL